MNPKFTEDHPNVQQGVPLHEVTAWPSETKFPGFRAFQEAYFWKLFHLSAYLLRGFALALGKEENFFDPYFTPENNLSSVRLIRYPYLDPYPEAAIKTATDGTLVSFESHIDISFITVLYQPRK